MPGNVPGIQAEVRDKKGNVRQMVRMERRPDGVYALTPEGTWEKVPVPAVLKQLDAAIKAKDRAKLRELLETEDNYWIEERIIKEVGGELANLARQKRARRGQKDGQFAPGPNDGVSNPGEDGGDVA